MLIEPMKFEFQGFTPSGLAASFPQFKMVRLPC